MSEELKPCPFCGRGHLFSSSNQADMEFVGCDDCGAEGPAREGLEAIAAWNTRAPVRVKPLVWGDAPARGRRCKGYGVAGAVYTIAFYAGSVGPAIYRWASEESAWSEPFETFEAAKAAAQADYERRIREALE